MQHQLLSVIAVVLGMNLVGRVENLSYLFVMGEVIFGGNQQSCQQVNLIRIVTYNNATSYMLGYGEWIDDFSDVWKCKAILMSIDRSQCEDTDHEKLVIYRNTSMIGLPKGAVFTPPPPIQPFPWLASINKFDQFFGCFILFDDLSGIDTSGRNKWFESHAAPYVPM